MELEPVSHLTINTETREIVDAKGREDISSLQQSVIEIQTDITLLQQQIETIQRNIEYIAETININFESEIS